MPSIIRIFSYFPVVFFIISTSILTAQSPVTWAFSFEDKGSDIEIRATAAIQKNWSMYSQHTEDNGPVPTTFYINDEKVVFSEKSKVKKEFDELFEVNVLKFKEKAEFVYVYKKGLKRSFSGLVNFMCCDNEKCLPPADVSFNYSW